MKSVVTEFLGRRKVKVMFWFCFLLITVPAVYFYYERSSLVRLSVPYESLEKCLQNLVAQGFEIKSIQIGHEVQGKNPVEVEVRYLLSLVTPEYLGKRIEMHYFTRGSVFISVKAWIKWHRVFTVELIASDEALGDAELIRRNMQQSNPSLKVILVKPAD